MDSFSAHYHRMIGLSEDWAVSDVMLDPVEKQLTLELDWIGQQASCPECGDLCPLKDHAPARRWRHLDATQFRTTLSAQVPRTNCSKCGVKTIAVPWGSPYGRFTLLFEAFAIEVLQSSASISAAVSLLQIGWASAQQIMQRAVDRRLERRGDRPVKYVGMDEKNFGRGQDYVSLMTDHEGARILEVSQGNDSKSADKLWETMTDEQRKAVKAVSMDMSASFEKSAASQVPQAAIVHDRFHFSRLLVEAVDKVRRTEHKMHQKAGDSPLTGMRQLLLYNEDRLSESRHKGVQTAMAKARQNGRAWTLKEAFREFWNQPDAGEGEAYFSA